MLPCLATVRTLHCAHGCLSTCAWNCLVLSLNFSVSAHPGVRPQLRAGGRTMLPAALHCMATAVCLRPRRGRKVPGAPPPVHREVMLVKVPGRESTTFVCADCKTCNTWPQAPAVCVQCNASARRVHDMASVDGRRAHCHRAGWEALSRHRRSSCRTSSRLYKSRRRRTCDRAPSSRASQEGGDGLPPSAMRRPRTSATQPDVTDGGLCGLVCSNSATLVAGCKMAAARLRLCFAPRPMSAAHSRGADRSRAFRWIKSTAT